MAELIVSVDDATMVPHIRRVIRSLHGVSRVTVPRMKDVRHGESYRHQLERLNELAMLPSNWDDDGAPPIEEQVVSNVRKVLENCPEYALSAWVLFPDINGTLLLKFKGRQASISIGVSEYSYSYTKDEELRRANHRPFVASKVSGLISTIIE